MSYGLMTTDGELFEAGFWSADTSRIRLGDLDPMAIGQFGLFATDTIIELLPSLTPSQRAEAEQLVTTTKQKTADLPIRHTPNPYTSAEDPNELLKKWVQLGGDDGTQEAAQLGEAIARSLGSSIIDIVDTYYANNPFIARGDTVIIGGTYEVTAPEFMHFSLEYFRGGAMGWDRQLGVPESIADGITRIDEALALETGSAPTA